MSKINRFLAERAAKNYIARRDEAMLAYPDYRKLDQLIKDHPGYFDSEYKLLWSRASERVKILTLERMIEQWTGAPLWLKEKVRRAQADEEKTESGLLEED